MSFRSARKNWEGLAQSDPLWSICTDPSKKGGGWDRDVFFKTGEREWTLLKQFLERRKVVTDRAGEALDFGCGAGRLSRAMKMDFAAVTGLDVSPTMIRLAGEYMPPGMTGVHFLHHEAPDLSVFPDERFAFVLSLIVLQHIPPKQGLDLLAEMSRVLRPGGFLVFQVPVQDRRRRSLSDRLKSWVKWRERLAMLGIGEGFNMEMHVYDRMELDKRLRKSGMHILHEVYTNHTDPDYAGELCFKKEEDEGPFLSLLVVAEKTAEMQSGMN